MARNSLLSVFCTEGRVSSAAAAGPLLAGCGSLRAASYRVAQRSPQSVYSTANLAAALIQYGNRRGSNMPCGRDLV